MKIFVDTAPFIYLIENHPKFSVKVRKAITDAIVNGDELVTSVITFMELLKWLLSEHPLIFTRLSNRLIASYLGISEATLSRLKSKL